MYTTTVRRGVQGAEFNIDAEFGKDLVVHFEFPAGDSPDFDDVRVELEPYQQAYTQVHSARKTWPTNWYEGSLVPEFSFEDDVATLAWTVEQIEALWHRGHRARYAVTDSPVFAPHRSGQRHRLQRHVHIGGDITVLNPGEPSLMRSPVPIVTATVTPIA